MENNLPEPKGASGVSDVPQSWMPLCLALLNLIPHGLTLGITLLFDYDAPSVAPTFGLTFQATFLFLLNAAFVIGLFVSLCRAALRKKRIMAGPCVLLALALSEWLFWMDARLAWPYARSLAAWMALLTPGHGWISPGAAGWIQRVLFWTVRLLTLLSMALSAMLTAEAFSRGRRRAGANARGRVVDMLVWSVGLLLCLAVFVTAGNDEKKKEWDARNAISERLGGIDCRAAVVLADYDSHGGFHGDGEAFYALKFDNATIRSIFESSARWHALPLPDALAHKAEGIGYSLEAREGQIEPRFPAVENGWFFYEDRYAKQHDKTPPVDFTPNYTLALFDADSLTLYYYEHDS